MNNIQKLQEVSYQILVYLDQVCREHGITYYLSGGTLLGAVRHQGFIPWDDDIDVMLPRPEYEKLIRLSDSCFKGKYVMHEAQADSSWYEPWMRICDTQTRIYWPHLKKYPTGLFIDVFPIDAIPADDKKSNRYFRKLKWYNIRRNASLRKGFLPGEKGRWIKTIFGYWLGYRGANYYCRRMNEVAQGGGDYHIAEYVGAGIACHYGSREKMKKEVFEGTRMVTFQEQLFPAPAMYQTYLSSLYGDYMKLPPKEKQVSDHKGVVSLELNAVSKE